MSIWVGKSTEGVEDYCLCVLATSLSPPCSYSFRWVDASISPVSTFLFVSLQLCAKKHYFPVSVLNGMSKTSIVLCTHMTVNHMVGWWTCLMGNRHVLSQFALSITHRGNFTFFKICKVVYHLQRTGHQSHPTTSQCAFGIYSYLFNRII